MNRVHFYYGYVVSFAFYALIHGILVKDIYRYCIYDCYDWEIPARFMAFFPEDTQMHGLHAAGLAREFLVYSEMTETYNFNWG